MKKEHGINEFHAPFSCAQLHTVIGTTPSKWRVYQFHHLGLAGTKIEFFSKNKTIFSYLRL